MEDTLNRGLAKFPESDMLKVCLEKKRELFGEIDDLFGDYHMDNEDEGNKYDEDEEENHEGEDHFDNEVDLEDTYENKDETEEREEVKKIDEN